MGKNTPNSIRTSLLELQGEALTMWVKKVLPKFEEPASSKFDPDFPCWQCFSRFGGSITYLMCAVDEFLSIPMLQITTANLK